MEKISVKPVLRSNKKFRKIVSRGIDAYNGKKMGYLDHKDIDVAAKDSKNQVVGGLYGRTYWDWLFVNVLWVDEKHRGRDIGARLLREAEVLAKKRKCKYVHLDTFSFQAPGFYRKLGYKRHGLLKPFPKNASRFYFFKRIR